MESANSNNESPPLRSTILGSFLRRPRDTQAAPPPQEQPQQRELSPSPPAPTPPSPGPNNHRRRSFAPTALNIPSSISHSPQSAAPSGTSLGISHILRRRRSAGAIAANNSTIPISPPPLTANPMVLSVAQSLNRGPSSGSTSSPSGSHRLRLVPHLDSRRTLRFEAITRDLKDGDPALRIGRFTDRSGIGLAAANALSSNKLAFKSKVVSRAHAEIWVESGKFFIKDTKSSSGTFLNHLRLSPAGAESKPHQLKDGDILQLGVDYQGGTEDIYKSVKIRIEAGREWQAAANAFNTNALSQLKALAVGSTVGDVSTPATGKKRMPKTNIPDCCICLFCVTIRQALFIAPCSHAFHYKCIRPLLEAHNSAFSCPLCRTFADLEEDVEVEVDEEDEDEASEDPALPPPVSQSGKTLAVPFSRDRDAGAETEVETEPAGVSGGPRRTRALVVRTDQVAMGPVVDMSEAGDDDYDDEMLGAPRIEDIYGEHDGFFSPMTPAFVSRGAGFGLPVANYPPPSREDMSEGEGEGSGNGGGSNEDAMDVEQRIVEADVINGKRKR